MDKKETLRQKRGHILELPRHYDLRRIRVFGSIARGDANAGSDVVFLVEPGPEVTVLDLGGFLVELREILGFEVDVVTENGLGPRILKQVLDEPVDLRSTTPEVFNISLRQSGGLELSSLQHTTGSLAANFSRLERSITFRGPRNPPVTSLKTLAECPLRSLGSGDRRDAERSDLTIAGALHRKPRMRNEMGILRLLSAICGLFVVIDTFRGVATFYGWEATLIALLGLPVALVGWPFWSIFKLHLIPVYLLAGWAPFLILTGLDFGVTLGSMQRNRPPKG